MVAQVWKMDLRGVKIPENETKRKLRSDLAREKGERKGDCPTEGFTQYKKQIKTENRAGYAAETRRRGDRMSDKRGTDGKQMKKKPKTMERLVKTR